MQTQLTKLAVLITLFSLPLLAKTYTSTQAGKWSVGGTWVGGIAPNAATDTIIINNRVTIDTTITCATITIQIDTLTFDSSSIRKLTIYGDLIINNGGGLRARTPKTTANGTDSIYFGNFINNGAIIGEVNMFGKVGSLVCNINGSVINTLINFSISGNGIFLFSDLNISNILGITLQQNITVKNLSLQLGNFNNTTHNVTVQKNLYRYSGTINNTPLGNYILQYKGTSDITCGAELPSNGISELFIWTGNSNNIITLNNNITINKLYLFAGVLNTNNNQVTILSDGFVVKYSVSKITSTPIYQGNNTIKYFSTDTTGIELPSTIANIEIPFANSLLILTKNITITNTLFLYSTKFITGNNVVTATAISRTTGYVQGNLAKSITTGTNVSQTFEVGTANGYSPVTVNFASVTQQGTLTVSPKQTTHPNAGTPANTLQRYFTITKDASLAFTNYSATINYLSADFNTGVIETPNDENTLAVGKYDGSTWTFPNVSNRNTTSNTITVDNLTTFSDFAIGRDTLSFSHYQITSSSSLGGIIIPNGGNYYTGGSTQTFTYTPIADYHFDSLIIDGTIKNIDSTTSYTFTSVTSPHTIIAYFSNNYLITAISSGNGTLTPNGTVNVTYGANQQFTFSPNTNYVLDSLVIDGTRNTDSTTSYTFVSVTENHTIKTYFSTVPVPVKLTSFTATTKENVVELRWSTATEINNSGFDVEKSVISNQSSEKKWEKIGFAKGAGTTNTPQQYSFVDKNTVAGKYYYRLKQVDNDGKYEYSDVVEVEISAPKVFALKEAYPNPFNPTTTLEFTVPTTGKAVLKVFNTLGQEVATLFNKEAEVGTYHQVEFNASQLNSGVYFARLEFNGKVQMRKIVLVK